MDRTPEIKSGILGGLLGIWCSVFALFIAPIDESFNGIDVLIGLAYSDFGFAAFAFSGLGLFGVLFVNTKNKLGGWLMVISGTAILVSIGLFGFVPGLFLISAGVMSIIRKKQEAPYYLRR